MNEQRSLSAKLIETIDQHCIEQRVMGQKLTFTERRWLRWLGWQMIPNIGTLLVVVVLLLTIPSLAAPLIAPSVTSTSTISYQGRLADNTGAPLTGRYDLEFRIYDVLTGDVPLWTELWTGANAVNVSDGLFSVMLGSIDNTLASVIEGHDELYLGITVGSDSEMIPRVQLGSVPFSMQTMTIPDGSITAAKIATGVITSTHLSDGAVTTAKLDLQDDLTLQGALTVDGTIDSSTNVLLRYAKVTTDAAGEATMGAYQAVLKPAHYWMACRTGETYWALDYEFDYNGNIGRLSNLYPNCKVVIYYLHAPGGQGNPAGNPLDWTPDW